MSVIEYLCTGLGGLFLVHPGVPREGGAGEGPVLALDNPESITRVAGNNQFQQMFIQFCIHEFIL